MCEHVQWNSYAERNLSSKEQKKKKKLVANPASVFGSYISPHPFPQHLQRVDVFTRDFNYSRPTDGLYLEHESQYVTFASVDSAIT